MRPIQLTGIFTVAVLALLASLGVANEGGEGENIALSKKYTLESLPNYPLCTGPGDLTDLTDGYSAVTNFEANGKSAEGDEVAIWTSMKTVAWTYIFAPTVTIDLGKVEPIQGVSYCTAAGISDVNWPEMLLIRVSDDGKNWYTVGDLVELSKGEKSPPSVGVHRFKITSLQTKGRYVSISNLGKIYFICDEVEVFRGKSEFLKKPHQGTASAENALEYLRKFYVAKKCKDRQLRDFKQIQSEIAKSPQLSSEKKEALSREIEVLKSAADPELSRFDEKFRAVIPLSETHSKGFRVYGDYMASIGLPDLIVEHPHRYDYLPYLSIPRKNEEKPQLTIEMLKNEIRADALNLTLTGNKARRLTIEVEGLPGGSAPSWLSMNGSLWTDTTEGKAVAAALPEMVAENGKYSLDLNPALTRRLWVTVDSSKLGAGNYKGALSLKGGEKEMRIPFSIRVSTVAIQRPRLSLQVWDYVNGSGSFGMNAKNMIPSIQLMKSHFVDTPWADPSVLPSIAAEDFNESGELTKRLDFSQLDQWVDRWQGGRNYFIHANFPKVFAGSAIGSKEFRVKFESWLKAFVAHLSVLKIKPSQIGFTIFDEPRESSHDEHILAYAEIIRKVCPDLQIMSNPIWEEPEKSLFPQAFSLPTILCPNLPQLYRKEGEGMSRWLKTHKSVGQKKWFYSCEFTGRHYDPHQYYRLQAWQAFAQGAEGIGYWSFGDIGSMGKTEHSWNEYLIPGTSCTPVFLGLEEVTTGIHWEAVREGIEDFECLAMVREKGAKSGSAAVKAESERLIQEALEVALQKYTSNYEWTTPRAREGLDEERLKLIRFLEK